MIKLVDLLEEQDPITDLITKLRIAEKAAKNLHDMEIKNSELNTGTNYTYVKTHLIKIWNAYMTGNPKDSSHQSELFK